MGPWTGSPKSFVEEKKHFYNSWNPVPKGLRTLEPLHAEGGMGYEPTPSAHWVADNSAQLADLAHFFWARYGQNETNYLIMVWGAQNLATGGLRNCAHSKGYCRHTVPVRNSTMPAGRNSGILESLQKMVKQATLL